jgi:hypothetical protein
MFRRRHGACPPDSNDASTEVPHRLEVLRQFEVEPCTSRSAWSDQGRSEGIEEVRDAGECTPRRYTPRPSWEAGGPKWDPYAREQSRAARVQTARRSRPGREQPVEYDRWSVESRRDTGVTHYQLLGVRADAPIDLIEKAYRRYAASIHPDKFFDDPTERANSEVRLRELNAIMQTLRDPEKRARYDSRV